MTKRDPDDFPANETAKRRDAALLKMLKTPHKNQAEAKKPRSNKVPVKLQPRDPWKSK